MTTLYIINQMPLLSMKRLILFLLMLGIAFPGFAQNEEEADASESAEKLGLRLSFDVYKINEEFKLVAKTRAKINNRYQFVDGVEVEFYSGGEETDKLLGKSITDEKGAAVLMVSADQMQAPSAEVLFSAIVQNNMKYEDADKSVLVHSAHLELELEEEDSTKTVKVFLAYPDSSGQMIPVEDASCQLYVKRLFGRLPVGEAEVTDEEGRITFDFPDDLLGDEQGNIIVMANFAEHEIVGNIEANKVINWGQPISEEHFYSQRELWSARSNSPLSLIIIVNAVLIGVWGVIFYIFIEINRINKIGRTG
jgi:hypothetical protein